MKTKILMTACLMLICSTLIFAGPDPILPETTRTIRLDKAFKSLSLTNVTVVLTNGDANELYMTGIEASTDKVELQTSGSNLRIDGTDLKDEEKVVVHISSKMLEKIELYGHSVVASNDVLPNHKLNFVVNDDYNVRIKVTGKVNITSGDGSLFTYTYRQIETDQGTTIVAHR